VAETSTGIQGAADRIRESAKWLTISLAAIGTILVAGSQLSDIGTLEPGSDRFLVAIWGAAAAAVGSAAALLATTWTQTAPAISLSDLRGNRPPLGTGHARRDESLRTGHGSVADLATAYTNAVTDRNAKYDAYLAAPDNADLKQRFEVASKGTSALDDQVRGLLKIASYDALRCRWACARLAIVLGGALAAAGIGAFAWAANPPPDVTASVVTPGVLPKASVETVMLTEDSRNQLKGPLGDGCPIKKPLKVLKLGSTEAGPDVVVQHAKCKPVRFILVTDWGSLQ
jgi:hypothetical protein